MVERLRVRQSDIVLRRPPGLEVYDTTYGRLEDGVDREGIELVYPGGLVLIYIPEDTGEIAADIHYDSEIELPDSQSLLRLLSDLRSYTQDMVEGRITSPDLLTVPIHGSSGLVNLFRKRFEFRREEQRLVYTFDNNFNERYSQLQHLARLSEQLRDYLQSLLTQQG